MAEIAQLVEHATENRGVHSSILCLGTRGRGSVVERLLAKEKVVGSNPIARSLIVDCSGELHLRLLIDDYSTSISNVSKSAI